MSLRQTYRLLIVLCSAAALPAAALASPESFLEGIGGSADPLVISKDPPEAIPLTRDARWVLGARFFSEKMKQQPMATAEAAQIAFEQQCRRDGGDLLPNNSASVLDFNTRFTSNFADAVPYKRRAGALTSVCVADASHVMGAMAAIVFDPSALVANADPGSKVMFAIFRPKLTTAVYAYRGEAIVSPATMAAREAAALKKEADAQRRAEEEALARVQQAAAFQKQIKVGDQSNCGLIVDLRGPLAQVQFRNISPPVAWVPITALAPAHFPCIPTR